MASKNTVTLGGERLGSGKKEKIALKNFERSNHDMSYAWRSTMSTGTLVPFMCEVGLPGDTFDIDLNAHILTHPTIGAMFGTAKIQLDVFQVPIRLFQGALHMNMLKIGLDMSKVKLPLLRLEARTLSGGQPDGNQGVNTNLLENSQINPSCVLNYLGIRGLGSGSDMGNTWRCTREFNAVPWLAYWAIYKQYYANKVEELGAVIHSIGNQSVTITVSEFRVLIGNVWTGWTGTGIGSGGSKYISSHVQWEMRVTLPGWTSETPPTAQNVRVSWAYNSNSTAPGTGSTLTADNLFNQTNWNNDTKVLTLFDRIMPGGNLNFGWLYYVVANTDVIGTTLEPNVVTFPLDDIDRMRVRILQKDMATPLVIDKTETLAPYRFLLAENINVGAERFLYAKRNSQEGLALKTYQSDQFNNWINTEWIDGVNGVNAITALNVDENDQILIDELLMKKKLYEMLNNIAVSGGSYDDWLNAVYSHDRRKGQEEAAYLGGLIQELVFEEVIGLAEGQDQPLGTLAGKGKLTSSRKGGKVVAKIDEPSYLIGIVSITPRIDYSQGNRWDVNLKTLNDFHKPDLDQIGFQDLITDQMAYWDTMNVNGVSQFKSAGKQPAWINYMTNHNRVYGNFAIENDQQWMVFSRRYEMTYSSGSPTIEDLTTYIDPKKFNYIFAQTSRDAMNYWVQIGVGMHARRKMSAKVMPNL